MKGILLKIYGLIFDINENTNHDVMSTIIGRSIKVSVYQNGYSKGKKPIHFSGRLDDRYLSMNDSTREIVTYLEDLLEEGELEDGR